MKHNDTKLMAVMLTGILVVGLFLGCATKDTSVDYAPELKQGLYVTTEDESSFEYASVKLYDDNKFAFDRGISVSWLPTGVYYVENGKLMLCLDDAVEFIFDIQNDKLIFRSGIYAEGLINDGTVFKLAES